jgi:hypothetical protein
MKIRQMTLTAGRTFNLGNFESLRVDASATVDIEEGEDLAAARDAAVSEIRASLGTLHAEFKPKKAA